MLTIHLQQVLSQIVAFLIMFWILKRFAWKPLLQLMEQRRNAIASEFDSIEAQKNEIEALKVQYNEQLKNINEEAKATMQASIEEGKQQAMKIQEDAHQQANKLINRAKEEIQIEVQKGKSQLKKEIVGLAISMTDKILNERLDEKKQNALISEFIQKAEIE